MTGLGQSRVRGTANNSFYRGNDSLRSPPTPGKQPSQGQRLGQGQGLGLGQGQGLGQGLGQNGQQQIRR